jgi:AraC-like DNA-binding protein
MSFIDKKLGMENPAMAGEASGDYQTVRQVIEMISREWREQPQLEDLAREAGMKPAQLQKLFTRWAGLSPKAFLQAVTLDHAKRLLAQDASVLDATLELGLSGPGRLHDLFVTHEAMSPGEYKTRGAGLAMRYGFHDCPFGKALVMITERGMAGLAFCDPGGEREALADMQARWPGHHLFEPCSTDRAAGCAARGRSRRRAQSDILRGAVPPRRRQIGRAHRLSLGIDAKARNARLGSGRDRLLGVVFGVEPHCAAGARHRHVFIILPTPDVEEGKTARDAHDIDTGVKVAVLGHAQIVDRGRDDFAARVFIQPCEFQQGGKLHHGADHAAMQGAHERIADVPLGEAQAIDIVARRQVQLEPIGHGRGKQRLAPHRRNMPQFGLHTRLPNGLARVPIMKVPVPVESTSPLCAETSWPLMCAMSA